MSHRCARRCSRCAPGFDRPAARRGFVVLPVTGRDVTDVANVQAHVGGELAARAALNITDDQLRELKQIQAQLEDAYAGDEHEHTVGLNHEFHRAINIAADSPKLAQLMSQITRYAPESVFPAIEGWPEQSMRDHRRILSALKNATASFSARRCRNICRRRGSPDRSPHRARRGGGGIAAASSCRPAGPGLRCDQGGRRTERTRCPQRFAHRPYSLQR